MATKEWWRRLDGVSLIKHERDIQKTKWNGNHDDAHVHGELAHEAIRRIAALPPWQKLKTAKDLRARVLELGKAGALIAAEIDRLGRMA